MLHSPGFVKCGNGVKIYAVMNKQVKAAWSAEGENSSELHNCFEYVYNCDLTPSLTTPELLSQY